MMVYQDGARIGLEATLSDAMRELANTTGDTFGIVVILDPVGILLGILTDGDLIRAVASGASLEDKAVHWMNTEPLSASLGTSDESAMVIALGGRERAVRFLPVIGSQGEFYGLINVSRLPASKGTNHLRIAVLGLGHVGLPFAATLAANGHTVTGVETNPILLGELRAGIVSLVEPQLEGLVRVTKNLDLLRFSSSLGGENYDAFIIAVGTPWVQTTKKPDFGPLEVALGTVSKMIKPGALIVLRSTVPVGFTRDIAVPIMERATHLKAGQDFFVAFAPERTVEGNALKEIRELPQIIGGFSEKCLNRADQVWQSIEVSTVKVESLEAAEMVKLLNNSFRDHVFAFSNAASVYASQFNIDAHSLISAANDGYPRNTIPMPSPGVGGYCLTKDPLIYASTMSNLPHASLAQVARVANEGSRQLVVNSILTYFHERLKVKSGKVLVVGLAFKGVPPTADTRGSTSIEIVQDLIDSGIHILGFDAVLGVKGVSELGVEFSDVLSGLASVDVVAILNNHPDNIPTGFLQALEGRTLLVWDAWKMLPRRELERLSGITYATLGYMSSKR
jgi:nucleotide sugar dehydrogenase